jgi:hypothetical protein
MIGSNSGDFVCTQVLHNLWKLFLCKKYAFAKLQESKSKASRNDENNTNPDEKTHRFDLEFEDDNNYSSGKDQEHEQVFNRNYKLKLTSNNNSKKKKFFTKIFSDHKTSPPTTTSTTGITRKLNQPIAKMRSEAFNNDAKRFQSLKRVAINRRINNQAL